MVQHIITPWRNRQQLLQVRAQLYPFHQTEQESHLVAKERQQAAARISVWMQRGKCPHLVESTAMLVAAVGNDVRSNSSYCVRAAYSASFGRFVTGLLDGHQDKRRKLSMYSIAKNIDLPATYVELRHQATHEELPSLSRLRTAAHEALRWIWDHYWAGLSDFTHDEQDCMGQIAELIYKDDQKMLGDMESAILSRWSERLLQVALAKIQDDVQDPIILLRCVKLSHRLATGGTSKGNACIIVPEEARDIEQIKAELHTMQLAMHESKDCHTKPCVDIPIDDLAVAAGSRWAAWEGPWVPKPIGCV